MSLQKQQREKQVVEEQIRFTQEAPVSVTCPAPREVPQRQPLREVTEEYRPPQLESLLAMIQETNKELHEEKPVITTIPKDEYVRPDFDYLDYQENEARLERLRNENLQFYSNFTLPPPPLS